MVDIMDKITSFLKLNVIIGTLLSVVKCTGLC
ncbi:MAG: hypothetical protein A4E74_02067 [Syntrophus sp. PtaB.Bin075]|nr:MAG: hypothetical protein A4E74_02067 [Syntrophus sp. PtaB.Bin075]